MKIFKTLSSIAAALFLAALPQEIQACTSWMVFADLTGNNTNILHKNRDSKYKNIAAYISPANSPRKWVALGNDLAGTNAGINTSGLAGVMNSGELCIDKPNANKNKKSTPEMMRVILESCDTAQQAVAKLQELQKVGDYWHGDKGSIFFFCDTREGYICEITARHCSVQKFDRSYTVRANIWQNQEMYAFSRNTITAHLHSSARAYIAIQMLNQALDRHNKIDLLDIFAASRHCQMPKESTQKRSVCGSTTNSAATLEIDRQYPDVLSALYVTIGPPRNTLYIPIPVCAEKLHPAMAVKDLRWSKAAWKRFDKLTFAADIPQEWSNFEKNSVEKFAAAKNQARQLLKNGKRSEAVKLINSTAEAIWREAAALLKL